MEQRKWIQTLADCIFRCSARWIAFLFSEMIENFFNFLSEHLNIYVGLSTAWFDSEYSMWTLIQLTFVSVEEWNSCSRTDNVTIQNQFKCPIHNHMKPLI